MKPCERKEPELQHECGFVLCPFENLVANVNKQLLSVERIPQKVESISIM